jgi:hypothetical protein
MAAENASTIKRFAIGWFLIQAWLTCIVCAGVILLLMGVFGPDHVAPTLAFLRRVTGMDFLFSSPIVASVVMAVLGILSFVAKILIEKYLFQIMMIFLAAAIGIWVFLNYGKDFGG